MSRAARAAFRLALLTAGLASPRPARAFVRYYTEAGAPFYWAQATVPLTAYVQDFNQNSMNRDQVTAAVMAAAATWSGQKNGCTYLTIDAATSTDPTPRAANDAHNSVIFRSGSWCQLAPNGSCEIDYDASALAFTWDTANKMTGQIYDSDIEVNLVDFAWADVVASPSLAEDMDLQNALTHEMGHFIGLDHTCFDPLSPSSSSRPLDNTGTPVPDCDLASAAVKATTMYPSAMPGDTQKRTLEADDQNGLCAMYPVDKRPDDGPLRGGCTQCAVSDEGAAPAGLALVGAAALFTWRRRRRA